VLVAALSGICSLMNAVAQALRQRSISPTVCSATSREKRPSLVPARLRLLYDERDFERLPELADALEQAGCQNPEILAHLRSPGPHVRGCWALDAVLGNGRLRLGRMVRTAHSHYT